MRTLRLSCWNVNGIFKKSCDYSKLDDKDLIDSVRNYDIFGIVETHTGPEDEIYMQNYYSHQVNRPKAEKACRYSGGLAVLIKNNIKNGVTVKQSGEYSIWLELGKTYFGLDTNIYVCIAYLPPENSTYSKRCNIDCLNILEEQIQHFSTIGNIILLGDLNARTAKGADFIQDDNDKYLPDIIPYIIDNDMPQRHNEDNVLNDRGSALLDLCISAGLRILNGRMPGDSVGYLTCHKYNGSSTVDYGIVSNDIFKDMFYFHVHNNLSDLSDHCQITTCIQNLNFSPTIPDIKLETETLPKGYIWDQNSEFDFVTALNNQNNAINVFVETKFECTSDHVNKALEHFNNIIINAANVSLKKSIGRNKQNIKQKQNNQKKWYGPTLKHLKKELKYYGKLLCANHNNKEIRVKYYNMLKNYKRQCKKEERNYKTKIINMMDNLHTTNPKGYWKLVEEITDKRKKIKTDIEIEKLYNHYKNMNTSINISNTNTLELLEESEKSFSELDFIITESEVQRTIKHLKNGKSSGYDLIKNEMIKYGHNVLIKPITKLFNLVLNSQYFPQEWSKGRIISIHKKGDANNPSNYRGITISSCVGKLFNAVLNNRLCKFLDDKNVICDEQSGFRKKHRTTDHMFILKNIVDKYKREKKPLFIAFIDFKQAFDTIQHQTLFHRLIKCE